jgi:hypothetical protein
VTSARQWARNRKNAQKSTGPRTEEGKCRSRRNAFRHGLTAETVVEGLEDTEDYRAFEATIIADYDAQTAVEREFVLRLASLLWRIRRATAIETDLLRIQAEIISERKQKGKRTALFQSAPHTAYRVLRDGIRPPMCTLQDDDQVRQSTFQGDEQHGRSAETPVDRSRQLTHCFLRLANLDNSIFDRLARYEATIWRQIIQTLIALQPLRRQRYPL